MRILLAVDGSVSSDRATELVASFMLPAGSLVRVVSVQQPYADVLALAWASSGPGPRSHETEEEVEAPTTARRSTVPSGRSNGRARRWRGSCFAAAPPARSSTRGGGWRPT